MSPNLPAPMIKRLAFAVLLVAVAACLVALPPTARSAEQQILEIASKTGVHVFSVELAVTDEERSRGLMFRRSVPESYGMLFDFKRDQEVTMWMRNTCGKHRDRVRQDHSFGRAGSGRARSGGRHREETRH